MKTCGGRLNQLVASNVSSNGCVEKQMRLHVRCVSRVLAGFYTRRASLAQRPPRNLRRDATPHWHVRCWSLVLVFLQRVRFYGHQAARPYNRLGSRASHALGIIFRRGSCRHHWLARYVGTDGPRRDDPHKTISGWALRAGVPGDVSSGIRNKREASATERLSATDVRGDGFRGIKLLGRCQCAIQYQS